MIKDIHITGGDYYYLVQDIAESFIYAFNRMGYNVTFDLQTIKLSALNINMGARIDDESLRLYGDRIITFNFEQVSLPNMVFSDNQEYLKLLRSTFVWDYSLDNIKGLKHFGIHNTSHVPIGYTPVMSKIISSALDIDVLFYGFETERRKYVLDQIRSLGLNVVTSKVLKPTNPPLSNKDRDELISRSKVILNCHAYDFNTTFEIVRASHVLANRKVLVSEVNPETEIDSDLYCAVIHGTIEQLPKLCELVVKNNTFRAIQEQVGFDIFSDRNQEKYLYKGLGDYYNWKNWNV